MHYTPTVMAWWKRDDSNRLGHSMLGSAGQHKNHGSNIDLSNHLKFSRLRHILTIQPNRFEVNTTLVVLRTREKQPQSINR